MGSGCSRDEAPTSYFGLPLSTVCEFELSRGVADSYRPNVPTLLQELVRAAPTLPRESRDREQSLGDARASIDSILKASSNWQRGCRPFEKFVSKYATSKTWVAQLISAIFTSLPEAVIPAHVCAELDHILRSSLSQQQQVTAGARTLSKMSSLRLHAYEALKMTAEMMISVKLDSLNTAVIADSWTRQHGAKLNEFVLASMGVATLQNNLANPTNHQSTPASRPGDTKPLIPTSGTDATVSARVVGDGSVGTKEQAGAAPALVSNHRDPSVGTTVSEVTTQAQITRSDNTSGVAAATINDRVRRNEESQAKLTAEATSETKRNDPLDSPVPTAQLAAKQAAEVVEQPARTNSQLLANAKLAFGDGYSPRESECAQPTTVFCSQCSALRLEVDEIKQLLADMSNALRQSHDETATLREQLQVTHHLVHGATVNKPFRDKIQMTVAEIMQSQVLATEDIIKVRKELRELGEQIRFANGDSDRLANESAAARTVSLEVVAKLADVERKLLSQQQQLAELDERFESVEKSQRSLRETVRSVNADVSAIANRGA